MPENTLYFGDNIRETQLGPIPLQILRALVASDHSLTPPRLALIMLVSAMAGIVV